MSGLETRVREEDPESVIASALVGLTSHGHALYGGDLEVAAAVMRTVANRIQYLLQSRASSSASSSSSASLYGRAAYVQVRYKSITRLLGKVNIG
jgi:hypothetical protein